MPWPLRRGRRALTVAVGGEAVGTWPWKRSRRAVALEARLSSRGLGGEAVGPWPLSFSYGRGRRGRLSFSCCLGRHSRWDVVVEAKPSRRDPWGEDDEL